MGFTRPEDGPDSAQGDAKKDLAASSHEEVGWGVTAEDRAFVANYPEADKKRLLRKLDWRLVPMLCLLYMMAYLDRANIGNAKIEGLERDLGLVGDQFNIATSIFFVPYIIFEIPSNTLLVRLKKPSRYIGMLGVAWGTVMTLTGLVRNFGGLVTARVFLGIAEAGFFPGASFLISRWYLPHETQTRVALFYTASAFSGAFSGLLAYALAKLNGLGGLEGWRWIFIIEGIASVLVGLMCFPWLIDSPRLSTKWLSADEIKYLEVRQAIAQGDSVRARELEKKRKWKIARSVFADWQLYLQGFIYCSNTVPNYGMKFTMPTIIQQMGYTSSNAQLLTVPPYIVGAISAYVAAVFSDRFRRRMPFIVGSQLLIVISFAILFNKADAIQSNIGPCYFAIFLACIGFYPISPGNVAWTVNNLAGPTKRAQGVAYVICIGNIGGIIGSYIYLEREKPKYPTGFGASFGFAAFGICCAVALEIAYHRINKKREQMTEAEIRARYTDDDLTKMGDRSPLFRYTL